MPADDPSGTDLRRATPGEASSNPGAARLSLSPSSGNAPGRAWGRGFRRRFGRRRGLGRGRHFTRPVLRGLHPSGRCVRGLRFCGRGVLQPWAALHRVDVARRGRRIPREHDGVDVGRCLRWVGHRGTHSRSAPGALPPSGRLGPERRRTADVPAVRSDAARRRLRSPGRRRVHASSRWRISTTPRARTGATRARAFTAVHPLPKVRGPSGSTALAQAPGGPTGRSRTVAPAP